MEMAKNSPLTAPTLVRPTYYLKGTKIVVAPREITSIDVNYITRPNQVGWGFTMVGGVAIYNDGRSADFQLHASEEADLVIKILTLAGITIKDQGLYGIGAQEDNKNIQQEKQ